MDPVTIGAGARCDGTTGLWTVTWWIRSVIVPVTLAAADDPVNGVTMTPVVGGSSPNPGQATVYQEQLPGNVTVGALAATLHRNGTTRTDNRTIQLGAPCTVEAPVACDPAAAHVDFSTTADQAYATVAGDCATNVFRLVVRMPDPHDSSQLVEYAFASGDSLVSQPSNTRQVLAADLFPCQWDANVTLSGAVPANVHTTGGSGPCNDATATVDDHLRCAGQFALTLTNGADATLPIPFQISVVSPVNDQQPVTYRQVAPGQTVIIAFGASETINVSRWGVNPVQLQSPQTARCLPPSEAPYPRRP